MDAIIEFIFSNLLLLSYGTLLIVFASLFFVPRKRIKDYLQYLLKAGGVGWMIGMILGTMITILINSSPQSGLIGFFVTGPLVALLLIPIKGVLYCLRIKKNK